MRQLTARVSRAVTALDDGTVEQPRRIRAREQRAHDHGARRLATNGDTAGIAAERGDGLPHPAEGRDRVLDEVVSEGAGLVEGKAAERAEPVVDRHDDDVLVPGQVRSVAPVLGTGTGEVCAAVDPHEDRAPARLGGGWGPDVEVHAVLGLADALYERDLE